MTINRSYLVRIVGHTPKIQYFVHSSSRNFEHMDFDAGNKVLKSKVNVRWQRVLKPNNLQMGTICFTVLILSVAPFLKVTVFLLLY